MLRIPKGDCRFECLRCKNTAKRQHGKIFSDLLTERREKPDMTIHIRKAAVHCRSAAKIGGGSEKKAKNSVFRFAFHSPCTTLPLRSQDRRRLGNGNKKLRVLFRIPLALHYLCSQKEKDAHYPYHITPTSRGGDFQYAD
ncbi:MAG: hypothetical protein IJM04_03105, partial [Prevotella sp.]|nr:hypothetical protein [Prevotella sp.]